MAQPANELKGPSDRQFGYQSNSSLNQRDKNIRSKSGGKQNMEFKSSFANNQSTLGTD